MTGLLLALLVAQAPCDACESRVETMALQLHVQHDKAEDYRVRLAGSEAEAASLRQSVKDAPLMTYFVVGGVAGLLVGAVVAGVVVAAVKR